MNSDADKSLRLLSYEEAASLLDPDKKLGIKPRSIRTEVEAERLRGITFAGKNFVRYTDLEARICPDPIEAPDSSPKNPEVTPKRSGSSGGTKKAKNGSKAQGVLFRARKRKQARRSKTSCPPDDGQKAPVIPINSK